MAPISVAMKAPSSCVVLGLLSWKAKAGEFFESVCKSLPCDAAASCVHHTKLAGYYSSEQRL